MIIIPPPFDPAHAQWGIAPGWPNKPTVGAFSPESYLIGYIRGVIHFHGHPSLPVAALPGPWVYDQGAVDGVKDLQRFFGLTVDGIVGPQTWPIVDYLSNH